MAPSSPAPDPLEGPSVADVGEDSLVAEVLTHYAGASFMPVGPGDDAAVLDLYGRFPGQLVVCTDTLVEGRDFRHDWSSASDVGIKTAAQNFADVAAMGGRPHALLVSLVIPGSLPSAWASGLASGLALECARAGAVVAGGDLSGGSEVVVTGTAVGTVAGPPVLRSGARPGDVVALSGATGRSGAGLALLQCGYRTTSPGLGASPAADAVVVSHRRPSPPYPAGPSAAAAGATAMIDTSDGLLRDALRVATASAVTIVLDSALLQPDADLVEVGAVLGVDPFDWVLTGGEDHELLACFPESVSLPPPFRRIGEVTAGPPAVLVDGAPVTGAGGFTHFA